MRSNIPEVRNTVAALRRALLSPSPEELALQVPALQEALVVLEVLRRCLPQADSSQSQIRRELQALAGELQTAGRLIANGVDLTQAMERLLAPASASYRPDGEPVSTKLAGSVLVRG